MAEKMDLGSNRKINLNGTNYSLWKNIMKDLLFVKAMHLPVFATQKPESKSDEEWEFEHEQVCGFIRKIVDENVYNHIQNETHARTLWTKLENLYASKTGNNKLYLLRRLMQLRFKELLVSYIGWESNLKMRSWGCCCLLFFPTVGRLLGFLLPILHQWNYFFGDCQGWCTE